MLAIRAKYRITQCRAFIEYGNGSAGAVAVPQRGQEAPAPLDNSSHDVLPIWAAYASRYPPGSGRRNCRRRHGLGALRAGSGIGRIAAVVEAGDQRTVQTP